MLLAIYFICTAQQLALSSEDATREAAFESVSQSVRWTNDLGPHDLELVCSAEMASEDSETAYESCRIIRERYSKASKRFVIGVAEGRSFMELTSGKMVDNETGSATIGGEDYASQVYSKYGGVAKYRCPQEGKSCLEIVRPLDLSYLPVTFNTPSSGNSGESRDLLLQILALKHSRIT